MTEVARRVLKVHLARTGDPALDSSLGGFERLAESSRRGHVLVDLPAEADLIVFTQTHLCRDPLSLRALRSAEAWTLYRERTCVVDWRDRPWCAFPGIYASMPRQHLQPRWQKPWMYPWVEETPFLQMRDVAPDILFSFIGSRTHPCRSAVLEARSPLGIVEDSGPIYLGHAEPDERRRRRFLEVFGRSKFVLCPRGHGTSSIRLQETLAAGRVPVVISDDWAPPEGPDWDAAVVRWPEGKVDELPSYLTQIEERSGAMSRAAVTLYDTWFASGVMFDNIVDQLCAINRKRGFPPRGVRSTWDGRLWLAQRRGEMRGRLKRR